MKYADAIALLRHGEKKDEPKSMEETRQKRTQSLQQDLKLARLYHQLGEKEKALAVLGDAANSVTDERDLASLFDLIQAEFELGMEEQALTHLDVYLKRHEQKEWPKVARCVARDELSPEVWLTLLRNKHDKEPPLEIVKRLRRLLSRSTTEKEFSSLADELEPNINALAQVRREHWLTGVATYCLECGWDAPAQKYLEKAVEVMDSAAALQRLADFHADRQQWKPAAELYGKAWDKDRTSALPLYWRGWCLVQLGQEAEGRRLMGLAVLLPLGNDRARFELAQAMRKRGLTKEADREFARLVQLGTAMSVSVTNAYGRLAAQAARQRDFARAADYWQKVPVAALDHDYYYEPAKGTWLIALQVRTERTLALIAGGQIDAARPEIDYCLSFLPGDADQTQRFCDELDRRGEKKLAEEVFTRSLTVHRDVCRQYPKSPGRHNNLAWLCARCRRGLDEALEHARKAVDLAPDEAGYLDTLAEVHFQRGETEKALELMKRCVEREPANRGYREQLVRFRSGDRTTEPPSAE
jgi:tetratricopeptide (TPR) repeat protein